MSTFDVNIRFLSQSTAAVKSARDVADGINQVKRSAQEGGNVATQSFGRVQAVMASARTAVLGLAGAYVSLQGAMQAIRIADQYAGITARLRLMSQSQQEFNAALDQTYLLAQRTSTSFEATASLYGRVAASARDLGMSQAEALRVTEAISQSFQVSGASAGSAAAAITQLSQGLASGVLRGDEFNSVMENAPRLAQAMADALGVTRGELRQMAEEGKLTSETIIGSLLSQAPKIQGEFEKIPMTVGRAMTQVQNAFVQTIGTIDQSIGVNSAIAESLSNLAAGIERIPLALGVWREEFTRLAADADSFFAIFSENFDLIGFNASDVGMKIVESFAVLPSTLRVVFTAVLAAADVAWSGIRLGVETAVQWTIARWLDVQQALVGIFGGIATAAAQAFDDLAGTVTARRDVIVSALQAINPLAAAAVSQAIAGIAELGPVSDRVRASIDAMSASIERKREALKDSAETSRQEFAAAMQRAAAGLDAAIAERDAAIERVRAGRQAAQASTQAAEAQRRMAQASKQSAEASKKAAEAQREHARVMAELRSATSAFEALSRRVFDQLATPIQRINREFDDGIAIIERYKASIANLGPIDPAILASIEETRRGLERVRDEAIRKHREISDDGKRQARKWAEYWRDAGKDVARAFGDWVANGFRGLGDSLKRIAQQIISDLVTMFARQKIVMPIMTSLGLGGGGNVATGGPFGNAANVLSSVTGIGGGTLGGSGGFLGSLGSGLTALFANPLVAAMAVFAGGSAISRLLGGDSMTGGLFGGLVGGLLGERRWRQTGGGVELSIGPGGGGGSSITLEERRRSLFRGTARREVTGALGADAQREVDALFASIRAAVVEAARSLRVDVPEVIAGAWREIKDASGKVIAQVSTVLGRQYTESFEAFKQRISAENILAVVASALGRSVDEIAERWRSDAEKLAGGAAFLLAATRDIQAGQGLLGAAESVDRLVDLIEELKGPGESLAETYARVSSATRLLDDALRMSGIVLDRAREDVVRFATGIADAAGGLDQASRLWQRYFDVAFSPAERAQAALDAAQRNRDALLDAAGLDRNATIQQIRAAIEQAIASGADPQRIVALLRAADAVATVQERMADLEQITNQLAEAQRREAEARLQALAQYQQLATDLEREVAALGASELVREVARIRLEERARIDQLNAAARAAGLEAAAERDLANAHILAANAIAQAVARARQAAASLAADLYGTPVQQIEQQIARLQSAGAQAGVEAADQVASAWQSAVDRIRDWLDGLMTGELGGLRPRDALREAQAQFDRALQAARGGDAEAAGRLPQLADQVLRLAQRVFASGDPYFAIRDRIREAMQGVAGMAGPGGAQRPPINVTVDTTAIADLMRQRDEMVAQEQAGRRRGQAEELAQYVRDIAGLTGESAISILQGLSVPLDRFVADLGVNISAMTTEMVRGMAGVANRLGIEVSELSAALGVDLGEIADENSLLNDTIAELIEQQAPAIADVLRPLFQRIEDAETPEERQEAIDAFVAAVSDMPASIRTVFAPFFDALDPETVDQQVDALTGIRDVAGEQLGELRGLHATVRDGIQGIIDAVNSALQPEAEYAVGTDRVPRDMIAKVHRDEIIIDPESSRLLRRYGIELRGGGGGEMGEAVVAQLRMLRSERSASDGMLRAVAERLERLERAQQATAAAIDRQTNVQRRSFA